MTPTVRLCLLASLFSLAIFAHADPQANLLLTPVFSNTQGQSAATIANNSSPRFAYSINNSTGKDASLSQTVEAATIVLDSKEYHRHIFIWIGPDRLGPGETWTGTLTVREYLPFVWRDGWKYSDTALRKVATHLR